MHGRAWRSLPRSLQARDTERRIGVPFEACRAVDRVGSVRTKTSTATTTDSRGGTVWLFAREELAGQFDYLFIDEAGQVALADALALSLCAQNVVLLGDPSQLAQVSQGRQPLHAGDSVLQHLLGDEQTVPKHRGIFLDVSYRMQPEICAFISDAMYEGRLPAANGLRESTALRW